MSDRLVSFIERASSKNGFIRVGHNKKEIPDDPCNVRLMPFFGDIRSLFILSSLLLHRLVDEDSKYFILCSWPGYDFLFPYVDEYWSLEDFGLADELYHSACQFTNNNDYLYDLYRKLNYYFFEDIVFPEEYFANYYNNGFTDEFWRKYKFIRRFLPSIGSASVLPKEFNIDLQRRDGSKLFIYPFKNLNIWNANKIEKFEVPKDFWISLIKRLLHENYVPVVFKGLGSYEVSNEFMEDCVYFTDTSKILCAMNMVGCVLDIFAGISRLAVAARCPFISFDERHRYNSLKEYEIDDLCATELSRQYIFSFPTIIKGGNYDAWNTGIFNILIDKLGEFLSKLDETNFLPYEESNEVISYSRVRKNRVKKLGTKFLKCKRL